MVTSPRKLDFVVINAFTKSMSGGNPAAVIYLEADLPAGLLMKIGRGLNQPITTFISPSSRKPTGQKAATFRLRWFITNYEVPLCGDGTLAAAYLLFKLRQELLPAGVEVLEFETMCGIIIARPAPFDRMEIQMPTSEAVPASADEASRIKGVLATAFGREDVAVKFIGGGSGPRSKFLLIELDEKENLAGAVLNDAALIGTLPFVINILTSASSDLQIAWETRMFAPAAGEREDNVTGCANCLTGPYWAKKRGTKPGVEMFARQVSARGGDMWVIVEEEKQMVRVRGELKLVMKGELYLH